MTNNVTFHVMLYTPNSIVGYELDGPGIESRCGRGFPKPSRPAQVPTLSPVQWVTGFFPEDKLPWNGVYYPPSFNAEVKEKVIDASTSVLGLHGLF